VLICTCRLIGAFVPISMCRLFDSCRLLYADRHVQAVRLIGACVPICMCRLLGSCKLLCADKHVQAYYKIL